MRRLGALMVENDVGQSTPKITNATFSTNTTAVTSGGTESSFLLSLPYELRLEIYRHIADALKLETSNAKADFVALQQTCRRTHTDLWTDIMHQVRGLIKDVCEAFEGAGIGAEEMQIEFRPLANSNTSANKGPHNDSKGVSEAKDSLADLGVLRIGFPASFIRGLRVMDEGVMWEGASDPERTFDQPGLPGLSGVEELFGRLVKVPMVRRIELYVTPPGEKANLILSPLAVWLSSFFCGPFPSSSGNTDFRPSEFLLVRTSHWNNSGVLFREEPISFWAARASPSLRIERSSLGWEIGYRSGLWDFAEIYDPGTGNVRERWMKFLAAFVLGALFITGALQAKKSSCAPSASHKGESCANATIVPSKLVLGRQCHPWTLEKREPNSWILNTKINITAKQVVYDRNFKWERDLDWDNPGAMVGLKERSPF